MKEAIILAGGKGTRLKPLSRDIPKVLVKLNDKPILQHLFDYLLKYNINKVILAVGYKYNQIIDKYKDKYKELKIEYSIEDKPLYTGGAIKKALNKVKTQEVFILNGDIITNCNLDNIYKYHINNNNIITIASKWLDNADRFGLLKINSLNKIIEFKEKQKNSKGYINLGIYLANTEKLKEFMKDFPEAFSIEKKLFPHLSRNLLLDIYKCKEDIYFFDVGTPSSFKNAEEFLKGF